MKKPIYFAATLLFMTWGCTKNNSSEVQEKAQEPEVASAQAAAAVVSEDQTKAVLDHHWQAFIQNDLEAVMADYSEESVLITPDATYKGLTEIRKNFENAFAKFPKAGTTFQLSKSVVDRDVSYILWQAKTPTFNLSFGTDTFVVRDGKIISQTFGGVVNKL